MREAVLALRSLYSGALGVCVGERPRGWAVGKGSLQQDAKREKSGEVTSDKSLDLTVLKSKYIRIF